MKLRPIGFTIAATALLGMEAIAQNCQTSANPTYLLNTMVDLARHNALPADAFRSMLPCKAAAIPTALLLDALQGSFTLDEKKVLIHSFHIQSPLRTRDVDTISKSSLPGQLVDELLFGLEHGDPRLELNSQLDPATISRLKQKGVSEEKLSSLRRSPVDQSSITLTSPPEIDIYEDPLARTLPIQNTGPGFSSTGNRDSKVSWVGGNLTQPILMYKIEPQYSDTARASCREGRVLLSVMVDETGTPRNIVVIRPLGSGLDEKATEAVSKWKFRPATMNGQTVAMQANIEVNFAFRGACSPMSLGVQIMEVHWNTGSYSGATGYGRGNVVESNVKQGFEFTFSCSRPFLPTEGSGLYPARWKKQDTRLVISTSEIGNPKKHSDCELRMTKQPFIYELRNTTLYTVPMKQ